VYVRTHMTWDFIKKSYRTARSRAHSRSLFTAMASSKTCLKPWHPLRQWRENRRKRTTGSSILNFVSAVSSLETKSQESAPRHSDDRVEFETGHVVIHTVHEDGTRNEEIFTMDQKRSSLSSKSRRRTKRSALDRNRSKRSFHIRPGHDNPVVVVPTIGTCYDCFCQPDQLADVVSSNAQTPKLQDEQDAMRELSDYRDEPMSIFDIISFGRSNRTATEWDQHNASFQSRGTNLGRSFADTVFDDMSAYSGWLSNLARDISVGDRASAPCDDTQWSEDESLWTLETCNSDESISDPVPGDQQPDRILRQESALNPGNSKLVELSEAMEASFSLVAIALGRKVSRIADDISLTLDSAREKTTSQGVSV
jgi:hypothetical protein